MEEKEMKMFASDKVVKRQSVDDSINLEREKRVNLDHAERGHFIPFAEVLKKLG